MIPMCGSPSSPARVKKHSVPAPTSRRSTAPGAWSSTETLLRAIPGVGVPLVKPVIAALHGYCIGMGMTLALHCDLRLAAKNAVLGYPEVQHGMISAVSALHLPQVIPSAQALEMLLVGA